SAEDARAFLFQLQEFAKATPFELENVVVGVWNLLSMGFAAEEVIPTLTSLGNAAAALGLSSAQVERLAFVFGQMRALGKVMQQDLLQLASAGINLGQVFEVMSEQTGKSVAELKEMQSQG